MKSFPSTHLGRRPRLFPNRRAPSQSHPSHGRIRPNPIEGQTRLSVPSKIGLFKKGTHEVVPIPIAAVHHPAINRAAALIKDEISRHSLSIYTENPPSGHLRYLQLAVDRETNRIQLVLILNASSSTPEISSFCRALLKHSDLWHSIWLNFHPASNNRILGDSLAALPRRALSRPYSQSHSSRFPSRRFFFNPIFRSSKKWFKKSNLGHSPIKKSSNSLPAPAPWVLFSATKPPKSNSSKTTPTPLSSRENIKRLPAPHQSLFSLSVHRHNAASPLQLRPDHRRSAPQRARAAPSSKNSPPITTSSTSAAASKALSGTRSISSPPAIKSKTFAGYLFFPGANHVEILALLTRL